MATKYIIVTSASEYVTGIESGTVSTTSSIRHAVHMDAEQARSILRTIKAKYDNGAVMQEVSTNT